MLHTSKIGITVLIKPSPPIMIPRTPIATEDRPINITCSSSGGSPPPEISWFREGSSDQIDATVLQEGSNMDRTTATISIVPAKEDDGTVFRCTVWNRAMGQRQKLEATTRLHVKCKTLQQIDDICIRIIFRFPASHHRAPQSLAGGGGGYSCHAM